MAEAFERRNGANIERHIQTILISVVTGSIIFAATYFFNDKSDKAVLVQQIATLTNHVMELRADIKAMQSNYVTKDEFKDHEQRLRLLEGAKGMKR